MGERFKEGSIGERFVAEVHRGRGTAREIADRLGYPDNYGNVYLLMAVRRGLIFRTDTYPAIYYVEAPLING